MAFSVEDFQDLIRLLQERPEWRADLRRLVLTDELLAKVGLITLPVVAGMWMTPDGEVAARATKVWRVTNGRAVPPEQV
jgi:hypothetical protein